MENFTTEKDSIVLLGLLAIACKNFDDQIQKTDSEGKKQLTHTHGLNIFAAITDNRDGEIIAQKQNNIHSFSNPMLHAEQLSLKEAIEYLTNNKDRRKEEMPVEEYYRNFLFNKPKSVGNFKVGGTLYTTLEPCPFCTTALLVTRMKRIVYLIPDKTYGGSFVCLKDRYYKDYDISYQQFKIEPVASSPIIDYAIKQYKILFEQIAIISDKSNPQYQTENATLFLDYLKPFLNECREIFLKFTERDLITEGEEKLINLRTLNDLQNKIK